VRQHFDLLVIGSGPAGHHAAIQGAKLGKSVALVERPKCIGGVCLNTGTIPSKSLREAAISLTGYRSRNQPDAPHRGGRRAMFPDLLSRCRSVIQKEVDVYRAQFARNGVEILTGVAEFVDPGTVAIRHEGRSIEASADFIVIACGTEPAKSKQFPVDGRRIFDADGVYGLECVPKTLIVVGGGVIGLEYASIFALLGSHVTLLDGRARLLEFVDGEIVEALAYHLRDAGVTLRLGETVARVEADANGVTAITESNKLLRAEAVLYAAGRQGATADLNLAAAGLEADSRGRLEVDERYRTAVPHILAAGDVIGFPSLASTSMEQGRSAVAGAFGAQGMPSLGAFPYGIYTIPEISFVGQTEEQLTAAAIPYEVGIARYREIARGNIVGDESGRLKLAFHRETEALLGVHIVGEGATELVHIGQAVMSLGGTARYFVDQVFNYPTFAECYKVAALHGLNKLAQCPVPAAERKKRAA